MPHFRVWVIDGGQGLDHRHPCIPPNGATALKHVPAPEPTSELRGGTKRPKRAERARNSPSVAPARGQPAASEDAPGGGHRTGGAGGGGGGVRRRRAGAAACLAAAGTARTATPAATPGPAATKRTCAPDFPLPAAKPDARHACTGGAARAQRGPLPRVAPRDHRRPPFGQSTVPRGELLRAARDAPLRVASWVTCASPVTPQAVYVLWRARGAIVACSPRLTRVVLSRPVLRSALVWGARAALCPAGAARAAATGRSLPAALAGVAHRRRRAAGASAKPEAPRAGPLVSAGQQHQHTRGRRRLWPVAVAIARPYTC